MSLSQTAAPAQAVAQLLWQRLFGVGVAAQARQDAVKAGCVEAAARNIARSFTTSASAGILHALVTSSPEAREALLAIRPTAVPRLVTAATSASASLCASSLGALRASTCEPHSSGRWWMGR